MNTVNNWLTKMFEFLVLDLILYNLYINLNCQSIIETLNDLYIVI